MRTDLYTADFDREPLTLEDVTEFLGLLGPEGDRPSEGTLFDCKGVTRTGDLDTSSIARAVVAFANTFGGLVFVGVTEANGKPDQAAGIIRGRTELKTRIQNALRNTVLPALPVKIGAVELASGSPTPRDIAVVQVPEGHHPPYVFVDGGTHKVIVRRNDESVQASLTELDALYEKRSRLLAGTAFLSLPRNFGTSFTENLTADDAYARIVFEPERPLGLTLHRKHEAAMREAVQAHFGREDIVKESRGGEDFKLDINAGQIARRWYMNEEGAIAFGTTIVRTAAEETNMPGKKAVFLVDVVRDFVRAIRAGRTILQELGWLGRIRVTLMLRLEEFEIVNSRTASNDGLALNWTTLQQKHSEGDATEATLGNSELADAVGFVACAVQRLLRRLRHGDIDLERFEQSIRDVLQDSAA